MLFNTGVDGVDVLHLTFGHASSFTTRSQRNLNDPADYDIF